MGAEEVEGIEGVTRVLISVTSKPPHVKPTYGAPGRKDGPPSGERQSQNPPASKGCSTRPENAGMRLYAIRPCYFSYDLIHV
jgi:hypothetical protein